jgi:predicted phosphoadenosine phosphosulfate sulfurtransferase
MKILLNENVIERSNKRLKYLFDTFGEIVVNYSGGKDSEVLLDLVRKFNKEKGLKTRVFFLDQELEWESTITRVREVMALEDVDPYWVQTHFKLSNASSFEEKFLECWGLDGNWVRPKEPNHIEYGEQDIRFYDSLDYIYLKGQLQNLKCCGVNGVRAEESPTRNIATKTAPCYERITWGKVRGKNLSGETKYMFYPIFDWSVNDVWKYIFDNKIKTNALYDKQFAYGLPLREMRVSSLIHETALKSLEYLQEFEPDTYERYVERLSGVEEYSMIGQIKIDKLPYMFLNWTEYRDYLVENLFQDEISKTTIKKLFANAQKLIDKLQAAGVWEEKTLEYIRKGEIWSIICNDWEGVKLKALYKGTLRTLAIASKLKKLGKFYEVFPKGKKYENN